MSSNISTSNFSSIKEQPDDASVNTALRLTASADLALAVGVDESMVIHTIDDLDAFMLK